MSEPANESEARLRNLAAEWAERLNTLTTPLIENLGQEPDEGRLDFVTSNALGSESLLAFARGDVEAANELLARAQYYTNRFKTTLRGKDPDKPMPPEP